MPKLGQQLKRLVVIFPKKVFRQSWRGLWYSMMAVFFACYTAFCLYGLFKSLGDGFDKIDFALRCHSTVGRINVEGKADGRWIVVYQYEVAGVAMNGRDSYSSMPSSSFLPVYFDPLEPRKTKLSLWGFWSDFLWVIGTMVYTSFVYALFVGCVRILVETEPLYTPKGYCLIPVKGGESMPIKGGQ